MANLDKLGLISSSSTANIKQTQSVKQETTTQVRQVDAASGNDLPVQAGKTDVSEVKKEKLNSAVKRISGYIQNITRELNFSIDEELGKTIVTVIDEKTGDVIRQIPSEDMLELSRNLSEIRERTSRGLLFKGDA